jgi:hypothetical protein
MLLATSPQTVVVTTTVGPVDPCSAPDVVLNVSRSAAHPAASRTSIATKDIIRPGDPRLDRFKGGLPSLDPPPRMRTTTTVLRIIIRKLSQ